jgi:hypothetical protein
MQHSLPHYRLVSEVREGRGDGWEGDEVGGRWRFILETLEGERLLEAEDREEGCDEERLALLSVVRGLEALDEPSHVILTTTNGNVGRGLRFGLAAWRDNGWRSERFGELVRVRDEDLWRRVDRALQFHSLDCRVGRVAGENGDLLPFAPRATTRLAEARLEVSRRARSFPQTAGQDEDDVSAELPCLLAFPQLDKPLALSRSPLSWPQGKLWPACALDWRRAKADWMAWLAGDQARLVDRIWKQRRGKLRGRGWKRWAMLLQVFWRRVVGEPAYTII